MSGQDRTASGWRRLPHPLRMVPGNCQGMTLIELVTVLVILSILASVAVGAWPQGVGLGQKDRLAADLRYAQAQAMNRGARACLMPSEDDAYHLEIDGTSSSWADGSTARPLDGVSLDLGGEPLCFESAYGRVVRGGESVTLSLRRNGDERRLCIYVETGYVETRPCES
ncbi:GspH/FimT family pseudopilin [Halorhodospira sp. M39old]|uniref:GspH/FimT family pseudopilin n=2 Tax=unclassified Halorhodospira TaxID=2626748 RepID=UPI003084454F